MDLRWRLLNDWQHDFPLSPRPFDDLAHALGCTEAEVMSICSREMAQGSISRIGGVFSHGAGGDALLAAMAVPPQRLDEVAAQVSACEGVNHNYAREHMFNLWFVLTGSDRANVESTLATLEQRTGLPALRLRMVRPYRIDLGFDLRHCVASHPMRSHSLTASPLSHEDWPLAALLEAGLPVVSQPYAAWAERLMRTESSVRTDIAHWMASGRLKRFGIVVRHHELGFDANAMTVFDVPAPHVDACGKALAAQAGVTLAYQRTRDPVWPYNLYAMVHGKRRDAVISVIERVTEAAGLQRYPRQVLFSTRRYKQTGARRFHAALRQEVSHAVTG